ncbi:hypothetical protein PR202_ga03714 [Eleusine coracana subsp. coracana]|uniref:Cytochrome b5 heme-binding domain-containing protein n=1 Tax=Eleusine coracana subsp. coracana TaxID=191504 RepID=A0AAV5BR45_ELECO|nr:hypothetical protein PR202_ga03714 [Eleusine coracana subsp. coracana]
MAEGTNKLFAQSEISLHASRKDCWVVIHGKVGLQGEKRDLLCDFLGSVYDVTKFLEDHPGGEDVLLHASASGDATEAFEEVGHSTSAISMMDSYRIGSIDGYVPPSVSNTSKSWNYDVPPNSEMQRKKGPPEPNTFLDFLLPLFVLGLAFAAWYYLTFVAKGT